MKHTFDTMLILPLTLLLATIGTAAFAAQPGAGMQQPPQAAYTACAGKSVGDTVQFINRRGETVAASCMQRGDQLVAVPLSRQAVCTTANGGSSYSDAIAPAMAMGQRMGARHHRHMGNKMSRRMGGQMGMAAGKMMGRGQHMGARSLLSPQMIAILDLSAAQQTEIRKFIAERQQKRAAMRTRRMNNRAEIRAAIMAQPFDEAALRSIIQRQNQQRSDMILARAQRHQQLFALFNARQKQILAQLQLHKLLGNERCR